MTLISHLCGSGAGDGAVSGFTSGFTVACGFTGAELVLEDVPLLARAAHDTCLAGSAGKKCKCTLTACLLSDLMKM
jgi:hypothetical protein